MATWALLVAFCVLRQMSGCNAAVQIQELSEVAAEAQNLRLMQEAGIKPNNSAVKSKAAAQLKKETEAQNIPQEKVPGIVKTNADSVKPGKSAASQHRSFTAASEESMLMGKTHRPRVVNLEATRSVFGLSDAFFANLIKKGFGPFIRCNKYVLCDADSPYRTADGSCNNVANPTWGKASIPMRRWLDPDYNDGMSTPRGHDNLPSARAVSRTVHSMSTQSDLDGSFTHMLMQWGQFLDHDITKTPTQQRKPGYSSPGSCCEVSSFWRPFRPDCFPIPIPKGDPVFSSCMDFKRSVQVFNAQCKAAPVEQLNELTAYIDASQVYGSSRKEQEELRTKTNGLLKQKGSFLPEDRNSESCNTPDSPNFCFKAGDERVNENPTLQSMHTIFVREHNRIAKELDKIVKYQWNDETLFQVTRKIVGAIMQKITYGEYLPSVLGQLTMSTYGLNINYASQYVNDYSKSTDASIKNAFSTAAFRMGHSMIRDMFRSRDQLYDEVGKDNLSDIFGDTDLLISRPDRSLDEFTRGLVKDNVQSVDRKMSPEVTDKLFKDPFGGAFDLAALNIQRGRDHGLPGYIYWREFCKAGRKPTDFSGLSSTHSTEAIKSLQEVYSYVEDIDLFPGAMSENRAGDSLLGPTFTCLLGKQFQDLKRGDRFWFEGNDQYARFTSEQVQELKKATLSRVICDNTDTVVIQKNAFRKTNNKVVACCDIPSIDLTKWLPKWSQWGSWSSCRFGIRTRTRQCLRDTCVAASKESQRCHTGGWWYGSG